LVIASINLLLAPSARHGEISEFRHRAGPLLVAVLAVWALRFAGIVAAPVLQWSSNRSRQIALAGIGALSLVFLGANIGASKRPRMTWGMNLYGMRVAPGLMTLAPLLADSVDGKPRLAVADQPPEARNIDEAAILVALSGVPAYISCPAIWVVTGGQLGAEAQRRLSVLRELSQAPNLEALRARMRAEGITDYVATKPQDVPFDIDRRQATTRSGAFAIYGSSSERAF
jgi:hypothetical protein